MGAFLGRWAKGMLYFSQLLAIQNVCNTKSVDLRDVKVKKLYRGKWRTFWIVCITAVYIVYDRDCSSQENRRIGLLCLGKRYDSFSRSSLTWERICHANTSRWWGRRRDICQEFKLVPACVFLWLPVLCRFVSFQFTCSSCGEKLWCSLVWKNLWALH